MALIKCKKCGQMISDKAEKCPNCGVDVMTPRCTNNNHKTLLMVIYSYLILIVSYLIYCFISAEKISTEPIFELFEDYDKVYIWEETYFHFNFGIYLILFIAFVLTTIFACRIIIKRAKSFKWISVALAIGFINCVALCLAKDTLKHEEYHNKHRFTSVESTEKNIGNTNLIGYVFSRSTKSVVKITFTEDGKKANFHFSKDQYGVGERYHEYKEYTISQGKYDITNLDFGDYVLTCGPRGNFELQDKYGNKIATLFEFRKDWKHYYNGYYIEDYNNKPMPDYIEELFTNFNSYNGNI